MLQEPRLEVLRFQYFSFSILPYMTYFEALKRQAKPKFGISHPNTSSCQHAKLSCAWQT